MKKHIKTAADLDPAWLTAIQGITDPVPDARTTQDRAWLAQEKDRLGFGRTPLDDATQNQLRKDLAYVIQRYCNRIGETGLRNVDIVMARVVDGKSLKEVAKAYGLSPKRIEMIQQGFLNAARPFCRKLRQHCDDAPEEFRPPAQRHRITSPQSPR